MSTSFLREGLKQFVDKFPVLSVYLRRKKADMDQRRAPVPTQFGFSFGGNVLMEDGHFEPRETAMVRALLPHYENFVNIGANIGYYCCHALQLGIPTIAFEPSQRNLAMLMKNAAINQWGNKIEIFPLALSDVSGILNFYGEGTGASLIPGWAGVPQSYVTRVPVSTLDRALGDRLLGRRTFFLVDVEGAELSVLRGALRHLEAPTATWLIEICISEHMPEGTKINPGLKETFDLFWGRGYVAYTADGTGRLVTSEMIERVVSSRRDDIGTHNFIFCRFPVPDVFLQALLAG